jgi:hypothetical protein
MPYAALSPKLELVVLVELVVVVPVLLPVLPLGANVTVLNIGSMDSPDHSPSTWKPVTTFLFQTSEPPACPQRVICPSHA